MATTLPLTKTNTYVDGTSEIAADDMNALEIGLVEGHHGPAVDRLPLEEAIQKTGTWVSDWPGVATSGGGGTLRINLNYPVGTTITEIAVSVDQDSATAITCKTLKRAAASEVDIETNAGNATTGAKVLTLSTDILIEADTSYALQITSAAADDALYTAKVTRHKDA